MMTPRDPALCSSIVRRIFWPRTVAVLLPCAALFVCAGCNSVGGKPTAPTDRNIATPNKRLGHGGLPPAPRSREFLPIAGGMPVYDRSRKEDVMRVSAVVTGAAMVMIGIGLAGCSDNNGRMDNPSAPERNGMHADTPAAGDRSGMSSSGSMNNTSGNTGTGTVQGSMNGGSIGHGGGGSTGSGSAGTGSGGPGPR